jgi:hypothetical protein
MNTITPIHTIPNKFINLLERYPNVDANAIGFPSDWKYEP